MGRYFRLLVVLVPWGMELTVNAQRGINTGESSSRQGEGTMLRMTRILTILLIALAIAAVSCSGNNPTVPDESSEITGNSLSVCETDRYIWGYYNISFDEESGISEVIPVREIENHYNVLLFLEQGPCTNCVAVKSATVVGLGIFDFEIEINHPFADPKFTGFDVRGVAIFDGSFTFPDEGVTVPDFLSGDGELLNPDGFTALYNSTTQGDGPSGLLGYQQGNFATPTVPNANLNGFKRYATVDALNIRNAYYAGHTISQVFTVSMPVGAKVFGYAVDASWAPATTQPVTDPMLDFPPEANCPEPWLIEASDVGPGMYDTGTGTTIVLHVYDYGGETTHDIPQIECPALFAGKHIFTFVGSIPGVSTWEATITNFNMVPAGHYKALVTVTDSEYYTNPNNLDLIAYQTMLLEVKTKAGWTLSWGGTMSDAAQDVAVDTDGNIYVTGSFSGGPVEQVDLDPGPGQEPVTTNGGDDIYLTKFNSNGQHQWTYTAGGTGLDWGLDVEVLNTNEIYLAGVFSDSFDFDPTGGIMIRTSMGSIDPFLAKFDGDGVIQWVNAWGGPGSDEVSSIAFVGGIPDVWVCGDFQQTVDFNPGSATWGATSNGGYDCYATSFDGAGAWQQTLSWGSTGHDYATGIDGTPSGLLYVVGHFEGMVDFDPGIGTDPRTSAGGSDGFLIGFDGAITATHVRTWGSPGNDVAWDIDVDNNGVTFICGWFEGTADFNPYGGPSVWKTSNGFDDAYFLSFSEMGLFYWVKTWGDTGYEAATSVRMNNTGGLFVGGTFEDIVNFDTNSGLELHSALGSTDIFITRYESNGTYTWARTVGGPGTDHLYSVVADPDTHVYGAGDFRNTADFYPGTGTEDHISNGIFDAYLTMYYQDGTY